MKTTKSPYFVDIITIVLSMILQSTVNVHKI